MENFHHDNVKLHVKIWAIQHSKHLTQQQKVHQISILKTIAAQATDSSGKTIWGITNCMIGSAMIIYPVLFVKSGIIISPLVMLVVATIQYLTCRLLVIHNRPDQDTYNQSVLRIGGVTLDKLNSIVNMLLFFFVCVAYFILISHNFYEVSSALFVYMFPSYIPPGSNQIVFSKYSLQWAALITAFVIRPILFRKSIDTILKLAGYSIYCVGAYAVFIFFNLIRHISEGNIHLKQFRYFNSDFSSVAGAFALSFLVHPMAAPILKKNINVLNNQRDLFLGYCLGASVCFYVGFMGALSCAPAVPDILAHPTSYSTIFDCVNDSPTFYFLSKIVQLGILFQNFTVMPVMLFMTRNQFINLVGKPKIKQQTFQRFTWGYLALALLIALCAVDVSIILSLDGAVVGFFMGYGIPIYIHLRCLFHSYTQEQDKKRKSLMESLINQSVLGENQHELQIQPQAIQCNKHEPANKMQSYLIYGGMLLCGVALGFFKISALLA